MRWTARSSRSSFVLVAFAAVTLTAASDPKPIAQFWIEPEPNRDLFCGVGGCELAPDPGAIYTILTVKHGGFSAGFTVKDPSEREWSAKLLPEARTEVVASRLLWGVGYHQPPIYYIDQWNAADPPDPNPQAGARFREKSPKFHGLKDTDENWSYYDGPFKGTPPMNGLIVLHVMLGSSDLKPDQNAIYTLKEPVDGATTWYVARDLGQTFGKAEILNAPRGDIDAFEKTGFIKKVKGNKVEFEWGGRYSGLLKDITTRDVVWICRRLDALTDDQWHDAFRAGGFTRQMADRFIAHMKTKIAAGLRLED
jgi:hypothetical protein